MDIRAAYEQTIEAKDAYIEELSDTIQGYEETFAGKDRYIEELLATIEAYKKEVQDVKNAYEQTIAGHQLQSTQCFYMTDQAHFECIGQNIVPYYRPAL